jgi:catechol 2,3-dioxygenase-like lactoylglutathione lyase family enzyme
VRQAVGAVVIGLAVVCGTVVSQAQEEAGLAAGEKADGFVSLFDGKTLNGWQGATKGYVVENGTLVCLKEGGGFLYTDKEYGDFVLRFDFKLTPGANNGLGIRTPIGGDPAYVGMELQILDDTAEGYKNLKEYQYHGSIYGVVPSKRGHLKPVGEWNSQEVICKGKQVTVKLNGETIVDADIEKASTPKTVDGNAHPGLKRDKGYICFCGHGARVEFKNLRIKAVSDFSRPVIDLGLVTSDVNKTVAFYTQAIGFTEQKGFAVPGEFSKDAGLTDGQGLDIRVLTLGSGSDATRLKVMQISGANSKPSDNANIGSQLGFRYLTIFVNDTAAALARLEKAGVKPIAKTPIAIPPSIAEGIFLTIVRDPDGNLVELVGPKK